MINVIYNNDIYLDPIVTSVRWSGDMSRPDRTLEVTLKNTLDGIFQAVPIELGRELRLYSDGNELFRGVIFAHDIDHTGVMSITAYDEAHYLTKNSDTRKFTRMTASAILRQLCNEFGIETGTIADTAYVIPRLILRDHTLFDMVTTALTETRKQTGRRFWLTSRAGALNLVERGEKVVDWALENGTNILGASYSLSIENMRNQVRVIGGDEEKKPLSFTAKDDALIERFGLMQHFERADSDATMSEVEQKARQLLTQLATIEDEARIEAIGNVEITAGSAVYVRESMTQIVGGFYVITDTHTWQNGVHRMELTVSGDESLPQLEYEETVREKKAKTKGVTADYAAALARLGE